MSNTTPNPDQGFSSLGLSPQLLSVLERMNFKVPTPIQKQSIPPGVAGQDIIGIAQTGTGKTLAFGLPMIQRLSASEGRGLILLPTRELALQVEETIKKVGGSRMPSTVLIGGQSMQPQIQALRRNPKIIIATPGRLIDHIRQGFVKLNNVNFLVLDEADRMLDMGFAPQINQILKSVPKERQTLLFSATMPASIVQIASHHMKLPVRIEVAPAGTAAEKVAQEIVMVHKEFKLALLGVLLQESADTVLVFSRTKHGAKKICRTLLGIGYEAAEIHSDRSLSQRREALQGFKSGKYRILVATDIAARGIDVSHIGLVINFDLPDNSEDYVHRIGRTGRAGKEGRAISFATPEQKKDIRDIERLIRKTLPIKPMPDSIKSDASRAIVSSDRDRPASDKTRSNNKPGGKWRVNNRNPRSRSRSRGR